MQISFDPQADAIYVQLRSGEVDDTLEAGKYVFVDVDAEGFPLGVELLFASRLLAQGEETSFSVNISNFSDLLPVPAPAV